MRCTKCEKVNCSITERKGEERKTIVKIEQYKFSALVSFGGGQHVLGFHSFEMPKKIEDCPIYKQIKNVIK